MIEMRKLKIEELFVGAWVQTVVSSKMKVYGVWADGEILLDMPGGEPVKACIDDVCGMRINEDVLEGFGFSRSRKDKDVWVLCVDTFKLTCSMKWKHGVQECRRCSFVGRASNWNEDIRYVHELQRWWTDKVTIAYGVSLDLNLKGGADGAGE